MGSLNSERPLAADGYALQAIAPPHEEAITPPPRNIDRASHGGPMPCPNPTFMPARERGPPIYWFKALRRPPQITNGNPMTLYCAAPGCSKPRAHLARHCPAHRNRLQRYGHPLQSTVTARDLEPYACRIASRIPEEGEVRRMMDERWRETLSHIAAVSSCGIVRGALGDPSEDRKATTAERDAARRFLMTSTDITARDVADIVIGLSIMQAMRPETFEDDRAFRFILARRFFGLSGVNAVKDRRTGSTTFRAYPPAVMLPVAEWLLGAFGEVAGVVAAREVEALEATKDHEARMRQTLACL